MTDIERLMSDTAAFFEVELENRGLRKDLLVLFDNGQTPTMVRQIIGMPRSFLNMVLCQTAPPEG